MVVSTAGVDRAYRVFDRLRSRIVLRCASAAFYDVYNDLTYARQNIYRAGTTAFRATLFPFEERAISSHFPPPPGTVLIGAAGGGREALALARWGYRVVAFEPAWPPATSLRQVCGELPIETLVGRYEEIPLMRSTTYPPVTVDLRSRAPFEAAILGWTSFSHLRSDARCIETLREFGHLTRGPILLSYYPASDDGSSSGFLIGIGYYRKFSGAEIRELAGHAGLEIVHLDEEDNWPHAIVRARPLQGTRDTLCP
jgi:hypothetical protein